MGSKGKEGRWGEKAFAIPFPPSGPEMILRPVGDCPEPCVCPFAACDRCWAGEHGWVEGGGEKRGRKKRGGVPKKMSEKWSDERTAK